MSGNCTPWPDGTILRLRALNSRAVDVATDPENSLLYSKSPNGSDHYINIGVVPSKVNDGLTLATIGRAGDVHVSAKTVSRMQCAFRIVPKSKMIMLHDLSSDHSTQVHAREGEGRGDLDPPDDVFPIDPGKRHKVVVAKGMNRLLGIKGANRKQYLFEIQWPACPPANFEHRAAQYELMRYADHAEFALTDFDTSPEDDPNVVIRYHRLELIGGGSGGQVSRVVNVDTGRLMAVKTIRRPPHEPDAVWLSRRSEARILSQLAHPHIVQLIWTQHWDKPVAEIFMSLNDGSLGGLLRSKEYAREPAPIAQEDLAFLMLHQMLKAIDVLNCAGIVHRDIKQDNILYVRMASGAYLFQLGDFGLSKPCNIAHSQNVGTSMYMAPEIVGILGPAGGTVTETQSSKADVWSLCVTLLYALDDQDYFARHVRACRSHAQMFQMVCRYMREPYFQTAKDGKYAGLRGMAVINPEHRASAAQLLVSTFEGEGLVTPEARVVPWVDQEAAAVNGPVAEAPRPPVPGQDPPLPLVDFTKTRSVEMSLY